jgi:hypothetical protein
MVPINRSVKGWEHIIDYTAGAGSHKQFRVTHPFHPMLNQGAMKAQQVDGLKASASLRIRLSLIPREHNPTINRS